MSLFKESWFKILNEITSLFNRVFFGILHMNSLGEDWLINGQKGIIVGLLGAGLLIDK